MIFQQDIVLAQLEAFLGIKMAKIQMRQDSVGRYKTDEGRHMFEFFKADMLECGYADNH